MSCVVSATGRTTRSQRDGVGRREQVFGGVTKQTSKRWQGKKRGCGTFSAGRLRLGAPTPNFLNHQLLVRFIRFRTWNWSSGLGRVRGTKESLVPGCLVHQD